MKLSQDKIAQIREANPIVEVIGSYIPLKQAGKNFRALCPFHSEKAPSFYISPEKGLYHCFGCEKSGNVFTFLMEYNKLTFFQAVKFLGERAGIHIEFTEDKNRALHEVNKFAASLYHLELLGSKGLPGRKWLEYREIKEETVNTFMLGYAPGESVIYKSAKSKGMDLKNFEALGLVAKIESGYRDKFKHKIIFPIRGRWGKILGFGTRVLDKSEPKYINSPESLIFKKGNILYGLYEVRNYLKEYAILVEGYTDLLTLYQSGMRNVVANLGTSLTLAQARLLKLHVPKVVIMYDSDPAGRKAAERAIDILIEAGLDVSVFSLPDGEDPDSFIKKGNRFDLSGVQSFVDFKFKECKGVEEKAELIGSFQQTLSKISNEVKRELWASEIAQKLGIKKELLYTMQNTIQKVFTKPTVLPTRTLEDFEIELLAIATSLSKVRKLLEKSMDVWTSSSKAIVPLVLQGLEPSEIINSIQDERLKSNYTKALLWEDVDFEMARKHIARVKSLRAKAKMREVRKIIEKEGEKPELLRECQKLAEEAKGS